MLLWKVAHRVTGRTKSRYEVRLRAISTENHTDYILEVCSPSKAKKEEGMKNLFDKTISVRKCSKPIQKLQHLHGILQRKHDPFIRKKSVVHKLALKKSTTYIIGESPPPILLVNQIQFPVVSA